MRSFVHCCGAGCILYSGTAREQCDAVPELHAGAVENQQRAVYAVEACLQGVMQCLINVARICNRYVYAAKLDGSLWIPDNEEINALWQCAAC